MIRSKKHKFIRHHTVTDAAVHVSQVLADVQLPAEASCDVWADSAYRSEVIETQLKTRKLGSKIHHKGARNKPLRLNRKPATKAAPAFQPAPNMSLVTK